MHELDDNALLRQFAEQHSEAAFAALVTRHVDKVYSTALRHTRNAHAAEEITQAVFVILAKKAGRLGTKVILAGWLYETARLTSMTYIRSEIRRTRREQEVYMQSTLDESDLSRHSAATAEAWPHIAPLLDDALAKLSAADRHAVVLRYFDGKSLGEVGAALGASEDAAKKRVNRAVEKLRGWFTKRGVTLTATVFTAAIATNSVQAAPVGLAATVTATAAKGAAVSGSTLTLIKGALKIMAWTKAKMAIAVTAGVLLAAGTVTVVNEFIPTTVDEKWFETKSDILAKVPNNLKIIRPTHFKNQGGGMVGMSERIVCRNLPLEWSIVFAYNFSSYRLALPEDFPKDRFDYLITLPYNRNDSGQDKVRSVMRDVIKKQFGFVAHRETRERDVLLLRVKNPNAAGLQKKVQDSLASAGTMLSVEGFRDQSIPMYAVASGLESHLQIPVLDQTGFTNRLAIDLQWEKRPGETTVDTTKRVVLDQLGLELVPSVEPMEMLVVEKVK